MLQALVKAEVLIRVPAYSNTLATVRKPVKYQFMGSAWRSSHWIIAGRKQTAASRRGQLLEDVAALYYYREFISKSQGMLTYPYAKTDPGYCDFILKIANLKQIALEFGLGQKGSQQVDLTMNQIACDYGLIFSESPLGLCQNKNAVMVPLRYFFLM